MTSPREPIWQLDGSLALLHTERLVGSLDLTRPGDGLGGVEVATGGHQTRVPLDARLMQLNVEYQQLGFEKFVDGYVRGEDLIANYAGAEQRSIAPQIYWRHLPAPAPVAGGIELVASVQTSLLDDQPLTALCTQMATVEILHLQAIEPLQFHPLQGWGSFQFSAEDGLGAFLFRSSDSDISYFEMVFPADFHRAECRVHNGRRSEVVHRLFPGRLEKGVIRRGRVRGVFLPRADDEAAAVAAYREFAASEPPLTA